MDGMGSNECVRVLCTRALSHSAFSPVVVVVIRSPVGCVLVLHACHVGMSGAAEQTTTTTTTRNGSLTAVRGGTGCGLV